MIVSCGGGGAAGFFGGVCGFLVDVNGVFKYLGGDFTCA